MFLPLCQWGLLVAKCWNSNITTGVNYSNLYLSFINFKQTWYVICSSRKFPFGWCWRGEDLEAVACKPIRNTLRFARLHWESETEYGNCRLNETIWTLWSLSSFVEFFTKWNIKLKFSYFPLPTRIAHTMATAKHTLLLMWSHDFPHDLKFEADFLLKFVLICLFRF
jgi:hypothetical protein